MGALDNVGELAYGAVTGYQRAEQLDREKKAFESDQAIRNERLKQDQELFPLRKKTGELQAEDAAATLEANKTLRPLQQKAAELNVNIAGYNATEAKRALDWAEKNLANSDAVTEGVRKFHLDGNPQHVLDAMGTWSEAHKGSKAVRNADGTITITAPDGSHPMTFGKGPGARWDDGSPMTPDDHFATFAQYELDPLGALRKESDRRAKLAEEKVKQTAIGTRQETIETQRDVARQGRATAAQDAQTERQQMGRIDEAVNAILKGKDFAGGFTMQTTNSGDAALVGTIRAKVADEIKRGVEVNAAAAKAVDSVRSMYALAEENATAALGPLTAANIDWKNDKIVDAAAASGNPDAKGLKEARQAIQKHMGNRTWEYMKAMLQPPKKKK